MSSQDDTAITRITEAEETSAQTIAASAKDFDEKLKKYEADLEEKHKSLEKELKSKGMARLEEVKNEAGKSLAADMEKAKRERDRIIKEAKEKTASETGLRPLINIFSKHINHEA